MACPGLRTDGTIIEVSRDGGTNWDVIAGVTTVDELTDFEVEVKRSKCLADNAADKSPGVKTPGRFGFTYKINEADAGQASLDILANTQNDCAIRITPRVNSGRVTVRSFTGFIISRKTLINEGEEWARSIVMERIS